MFARNKVVKGLGIGVVVFAILGFLTFAAVHYVFLKSDAYAAAEKFVRSSPEVAKGFGKLSDVRLSWKEEASLVDDDSHGRATFVLNVEGDAGRGTIRVELEKASARWDIRKASAVLNKGSTVIQLI